MQKSDSNKRHMSAKGHDYDKDSGLTRHNTHTRIKARKNTNAHNADSRNTHAPHTKGNKRVKCSASEQMAKCEEH